MADPKRHTEAAKRTNEEAARWREAKPTHAGTAAQKATRQREIARGRRAERS